MDLTIECRTKSVLEHLIDLELELSVLTNTPEGFHLVGTTTDGHRVEIRISGEEE